MHIPSMNTVGGSFHMSSLNKGSNPWVHVTQVSEFVSARFSEILDHSYSSCRVKLSS